MEPTDLTYSIALVGAMNPRIHSPEWYKAIGVLSETELSAILEDTDFVVASPLAQFGTKDFEIHCAPNRWLVRTKSEEEKSRIADITVATFDKALPHTPVSAFGFNFDYEIDVGPSISVGQKLAELLSNLPIQLPDGGSCQGGFKFECQYDDYKWKITLDPHPSETSKVLLKNNFHFDIKEEGMFELAPYLDRYFEGSQQSAWTQSEKIVSGFQLRA
jgi:hypothetical protein